MRFASLTGPFHNARTRGRVGWLALSLSMTVLGLNACSTPPSIVQGPMYVPPVQPPLYVEHLNNGAIFQANAPSAFLFADARKPSRVGDTVKVDISESMSATNNVKTGTSRENAIASKGPGTTRTGGGIINSILNLNASASGSDSYKGTGATENDSSLKGQLATSVINVLPNGNLVVAGERSIALNGGVSALRFSGIVNPKDIKAGNIVASADTVNPRIEVVGRGDVSDAASRSWIQRVLASSMAVW